MGIFIIKLNIYDINEDNQLKKNRLFLWWWCQCIKCGSYTLWKNNPVLSIRVELLVGPEGLNTCKYIKYSTINFLLWIYYFLYKHMWWSLQYGTVTVTTEIPDITRKRFVFYANFYLLATKINYLSKNRNNKNRKPRQDAAMLFISYHSFLRLKGVTLYS